MVLTAEIESSLCVFISFCSPPSVIYIFRHLGNTHTSSGLQAALRYLVAQCRADGAQTMKLINEGTVSRVTPPHLPLCFPSPALC